MGPAAEKITLIHFNDVYNVESREQEPIGGAARFCTAVKSYAPQNPMILFSGDIFAPSISKFFFLQCSVFGIEHATMKLCFWSLSFRPFWGHFK